MGRRPRLKSEQRSTAISMLHGVIESKVAAENLYRDLKGLFMKFDEFRAVQGQG